MFDLPSNVLACIFFQWLDVKLLTRYDVALCKHADRAYYLEVLKCRGFALKEVRKRCDMDDSVLIWVSDRSLQVAKAEIVGLEDVAVSAA
jgi:hypothetical protein